MKKRFFAGLLFVLLCGCAGAPGARLQAGDGDKGIEIDLPEGWRLISRDGPVSVYGHRGEYFCRVTVNAAFDLDLSPVDANFKRYLAGAGRGLTVEGILGTDSKSAVINYICRFGAGGQAYMGEGVYGNNNVAEYDVIFYTALNRFPRARPYLSSLQGNITVRDRELAYVFDVRQELLLKQGAPGREEIVSTLDYARDLFKFRDSAPDNLARTIDTLRVLLYRLKMNGLDTLDEYGQGLRLLSIAKDALSREFEQGKARMVKYAALLDHERTLESAHFLMGLFSDHTDPRYLEAQRVYKAHKDKAGSHAAR